MKNMPGGFHLFFGDLLGLILWHFSTGKDGKKRWSLGLLFVFMINNHVGPDSSVVWQFLAELTHSEVFYLAANAVHSYLGFILFAPIYAALWYAVLYGIGRFQVKKTIARDELATNPVYLNSYADVFLVVLIGGISHHFIDALGHAKLIDGTPYLRGRFVLMAQDEWIVAAWWGSIAAIIIGCLIIYYVLVIHPSRQQFGQKIRDILRSKQFLKVMIFFGIGLLNSLFLYLVMLPYGSLSKSPVTPWPGFTYTVINFNLAYAIISWGPLPSGEATWYLTTCVVCFIVLFFILSVKMKRVTLFGHTFRAELLAFGGFLVAMLVGYLLQPIIGNISRTEADLGILTFIWCTIGAVLVGAAFVHAKIYEETRNPNQTP